MKQVIDDNLETTNPAVEHKINNNSHHTPVNQQQKSVDLLNQSNPNITSQSTTTSNVLKRLVKRYLFALLMLALFVALFLIDAPKGVQAVNMTWANILEMLAVVPPIFVLLGLLDIWVPRKTMIRLTGEGSGVLGMLIAFLLGSFAAGPLYAAFPVAGLMLKKGSKLSNVFILIGAWSTTKIPLLLFEASAMGLNFMLLRFALNIPVILLIAWLSEKLLSEQDRLIIYKTAEETA